MRHIIKKQILNIKFPEELDAFKLQHTASTIYWNKIVKQLEKLFDEISNDDETVVIDSMEIDLGVFTEKEYEKGNWILELPAKISKEIHNGFSNSDKAIKVVRVARPVNVCSQWLSYMESGHLPWNASDIDAAWYENVLQVLASDFATVTELRVLILKNSFALKRIVRQHSENFLVKLTEILTAEKQNNLPTVVNELSQLFYALNKNITQQATEQKIKVKLNVWEQVLSISSREEKQFTSLKIAEHILIKFKNQLMESKKLHPSISSKLKIIKPVLEKKRKIFEKELTYDAGKESVKDQLKTDNPDFKEIKKASEKGLGYHKENLKKKSKDDTHSENIRATENKTKENKISKNKEARDKTITHDESKNETAMNAEAINKLPIERNEQDELSNSKINKEDVDNPFISLPGKQSEELLNNPFRGIDTEGIFVTKTGVVLLHPFLKTLFEKINLIKDSKFINPKAHQKALYLIHYLATGKTKAEEHELVVAKVLCNYPLEVPVETSIIISKKEIKECNNLLNVVIENWDKLKNTSIEGLREGFLQRNGKLYSKNGNIYLMVESAAIDVLLDFLPWNLSMIKLPWMKEMLRVEWR